jgi:hypothetical protein
MIIEVSGVSLYVEDHACTSSVLHRNKWVASVERSFQNGQLARLSHQLAH